MKKLYFLALMGAGLVASAQTSRIPAATANKALPMANVNKKTDYSVPSPVRLVEKPSRTSGYNKAARWTTVGRTNFDRQTNSSVYRRIWAHNNGKVSVIWTTSSDGAGANFLGRGTGYNHYDGSAWGPVTLQRIEQSRTGYPNLDFDGTTEIVMSHRVDTAGRSGGLAYNTNGSVGGNVWSSTTVLPPANNRPSVLWPRTVISNGYMHVLATFTSPSTGQDSAKMMGVTNPTVYSRYNLNTSTWEIQNVTLPGYDSSRWVNGSADGYAMDARGSTVAVIIGGTTDDITMWKSTDNGTNWTSTIIDSFPVPAFKDQELILDTPVVTDGSLSIRLDSTNNAHCFWGRLRMLNTETDDNTNSVFLGTNSIDYWYEGRPDSIVSVAGAPDLNNDGNLNIGSIDSRSRYGNAGVATMPYAIFDETGRIFVVYSALTDDDLEAQGAGFRDLFVIFSDDNGATWSDAQNLTGVMGFNIEQIFGSATIKDGIFHVTFMESAAVGFFDDTDNPNKIGPFDIIYYAIPVSNILGGSVGLNDNNQNNVFSVATNYPNPFRNSTIVPVKLNEQADVTITVVNILGEVVYNKTFANNTIGVNEFEINGNFKPGFYFYNVESKGFKASGKMLAE